MHEQAHHPPARPARSTGSDAKPRVPVRRPVAPSGDQPEDAVQRKEDCGVAAAPPAEPPPIVARILRACASCRREEEERSTGLALSHPGDSLEKEADQVADRVMRTADPTIDRAPAAIRVSRAQDDEEGLVARSEAPGAPSTGTASMVRDTVRSSGQPLSGATRAFMEPRFGRDFGDVRVHTDARASKSAEAVSALAYTVGSNIVFRSGQYAPGTPAGARLLAHELAHVAQQAPGAPIQRATAADHGAVDKGAADSGTAMTGAKPRAAGVIVEDDETTPLDPKQMRKTVFLAALRPRVDEAVDQGYSSVVDRITGRAAVAARFAMYGAQSAKSLEQTLRREVGGAGSAAGYIGAVVARVRAEVAADEKDKREEKDQAIFFKAREGGPRAPDDPRTVKTALGQGGQPLPSGVRSGMESAMGQDFSGVRVHTGATAAKVSSGLNARALTVGQDIAFAAGEYQPGTPIGDALIAHELAHVVQQGNSRDAAVAAKSESAHDGPLESAADEAAMGAVLSMWGGVKAGALGLAAKVGAGLKSGLKLQRCSKKPPEPGPDAGPPEPAPVPKTPVCPKKDGLHFFPGVQLMIFIRGGREVAHWPAVGGPPSSEQDNVMDKNPTTEGEYRILREEAYHDPKWKYSRIAWGTPLQDHPELNDVYYQVRVKKGSPVWGSMSKDFGIQRQEIIVKNSIQYGQPSVPPTWIFNDFGPKAFRYYRDVNHNKKFDPGTDVLMGEMIHTTPSDEAARAKGTQKPLSESHGCVHVQPADRDAMIKIGALKPGTPFIVHSYNDEYKCP